MVNEIQFGVDVGGTFTDILVRSERDGSIISAFKVLSTPSSPAEAISHGIEKFFEEFCKKERNPATRYQNSDSTELNEANDKID